MTRWPMLMSAALLLQACFVGSGPYVAPRPADAPELEARVQADSTEPGAVVALALLRWSGGRTEDARSLLATTDEALPGDPAIPLLLAATEERLGDFISARDRYDAYRRSWTGMLARRAEDRIVAVAPHALRMEVRAGLGSTLGDAPRPDPDVVAVLPLARTSTDTSADAESVALAALTGRDLAEHGWRAVDDARVRVLLDEMDVQPPNLGDVALGIEVGHRLGAGRVVQGTARRLALDVVEWDVTVTTVDQPMQVHVDQMALRGSVGQILPMRERLAVMVREALDGSPLRNRSGTTYTVSQDALVALGTGLRAMDRGDWQAAHAAFARAVEADDQFEEARAMSARSETALGVPPLDSLVSETARVGALQRNVLAIRQAPASAQRNAAVRVGASERGQLSDLLGLDALSGDALLDVTFTIPGTGP